MKVFNRKNKGEVVGYGAQSRKERIKEEFEQARALQDAINTPILKVEIRVDGNHVFQYGSTSFGLLVDAIGEEATNKWISENLMPIEEFVKKAVRELNDAYKTAIEKRK